MLSRIGELKRRCMILLEDTFNNQIALKYALKELYAIKDECEKIHKFAIDCDYALDDLKKYIDKLDEIYGEYERPEEPEENKILNSLYEAFCAISILSGPSLFGNERGSGGNWSRW